MSYATFLVDSLAELHKVQLLKPKLIMLRRSFIALYTLAVRKLRVPLSVTKQNTPDAWLFIGSFRVGRSVKELSTLFERKFDPLHDNHAMADVLCAVEQLIDEQVIPHLEIGQEEIKEAEEWEKLSTDKLAPSLLIFVLKQLTEAIAGKKQEVVPPSQ